MGFETGNDGRGEEEVNEFDDLNEVRDRNDVVDQAGLAVILAIAEKYRRQGERAVALGSMNERNASLLTMSDCANKDHQEMGKVNVVEDVVIADSEIVDRMKSLKDFFDHRGKISTFYGLMVLAENMKNRSTGMTVGEIRAEVERIHGDEVYFRGIGRDLLKSLPGIRLFRRKRRTRVNEVDVFAVTTSEFAEQFRKGLALPDDRSRESMYRFLKENPLITFGGTEFMMNLVWILAAYGVKDERPKVISEEDGFESDELMAMKGGNIGGTNRAIKKHGLEIVSYEKYDGFRNALRLEWTDRVDRRGLGEMIVPEEKNSNTLAEFIDLHSYLFGDVNSPVFKVAKYLADLKGGIVSREVIKEIALDGDEDPYNSKFEEFMKYLSKLLKRCGISLRRIECTFDPNFVEFDEAIDMVNKRLVAKSNAKDSDTYGLVKIEGKVYFSDSWFAQQHSRGVYAQVVANPMFRLEWI